MLGAKAIFDKRLGTDGRSIALINHKETVDTLPLANATNLSMVLNGIGKVMDPENDVLVLFITTHGAKKILSVSFPRFSLNDISPTDLDEMLKASQIKNKVLIVSACYSGSFIPDLADKDTLIMTASDAENPSFGCSNERKWTYFGDALFNHALRTTRSLPEAFNAAKATIKTWETEQKLIASNPQMSVGSDIGKKLQAFVGNIEEVASVKSETPIEVE